MEIREIILCFFLFLKTEFQTCLNANELGACREEEMQDKREVWKINGMRFQRG